MKMLDNDHYIVVYECCRIVKGHDRSLFCDIQRKSYRFIPNDLAELLERSKDMTIGELKKSYRNQYDDIIESNISLLEVEEFVFFTKNPEWFPSMNMQWMEPTKLTNAIVDIDSMCISNLRLLWPQFSELGCEHVQLRSYVPMEFSKLENIINEIGSLRIISLELIMAFDQNITVQEWIEFVYRIPRIYSIILHSADEDKVVFNSSTNMGNIYKVKKRIDGVNHCGQINPEFFTIHIKSYTESLHHNSCLNRKISIDTEGNIKNCPSMTESYGNIRDTTLAEAIEKPGFKKYWDINNDKIHVCKDCEFRYICTDCRAYVEDPADILSKPLKCGYNPYTGEWSEWSTNPLKQKAIDHFGMREMVEEKG